jgi:hypothetical protein
MSASTTQPMTGHANQAAPIGAIVILAGALALGAVGIAVGQGYKATPASVAVPADVEAALIAHRAGERAPLWSIEEVLAAQRAGEKAPLFSAQDSLLIQRLGEFRDKALALRNTGVPASATQYGYGYPTAVAAPVTVIPSIINGTAAGSQFGFPSAVSGLSAGAQSGLNGTDVIPRSVFYPATWGQSGLNGTDVIPRSVFAGPATGAQKGLSGKTEHTTRPPVRRAGHYRD